jgi:argininosuccinate synthase
VKKYQKILLAYSGGLDTTVAIPWLREKTGADIVAVGVDVGQPDDLEAAVTRAMSAGASEAYFIDAKEAFADEVLLKALWTNALYEGEYPLLSALSRPLIVEKIVAEATKVGADAVAHGCTGKGNDQVRFELSLAALAPGLPVLAPARHWGLTRDDALKYAYNHGIEVDWNAPPYSIDENLWGRAVECGVLEDAWTAPPPDAYKITADPAAAPGEPYEVTVDFVAGTPVALSGYNLPFIDLVTQIGKLAGGSGVGRIDMIENRTVGLKSREVYECPAAVALLRAHKALESMVLTRAEAHFKPVVEAAWANLVYAGQWHTPLRQALDAFVASTQKFVTGSVRLRMYKGNLCVTGRKSPYSIYDDHLATYGEGDPFDHAASEGFIKISAMEIATLAQKRVGASALFEVMDHEKASLAQPVS